MKSLIFPKINILFLLAFSISILFKKTTSNKLNPVHKNNNNNNNKNDSQNKINFEIINSFIKKIFNKTHKNSHNNINEKQKQTRNLSINYKTFDNEINSVYGTGNILKDVVYKVNCVLKCKSNCCSGEFFSNIICLSESQCNKKIQKVKKFILKTVFISYASLAAFTSLVIFFVYFLLSKKLYATRQSAKNAFAALIICVSVFLVIPIIFIFVYSIVKRKKIFAMLGADFSKFKSFVAVTETKDEDRLLSYSNRKDNNGKLNNYSIELKIAEENIKVEKIMKNEFFQKLKDNNHENNYNENNNHEIKLDSESNLIHKNKINSNKDNTSNRKNSVIKSNSDNSGNYHNKIKCNKDDDFAGEFKVKIDQEFSYKEEKNLHNDSDILSDLNRNLNLDMEDGIGVRYDKNYVNVTQERTNNKLFKNKNVSVNEINLD